MSIDVNERIVSDFVKNKIELVTTVPCKQLATTIEKIDENKDIYHIPSNKEDEGMGICAGGVTINTLATLTQYYRIPLPMLISYRGELGEPVACQVEMALHTKALLKQMNIPTYHFHNESDVEELDKILQYTFMCNKPVAILTDATFWKGY